VGTTHRRKLPDLIEDVFANAPQYEFFQVIRLLEGGWYGHGQIGQGLDKWLRMRPAPEISFPAADVRRCELDDNGKADLQLNFMGLYGVDAPVPHYFTELIARDDESSEAMRAFLDLFSHRLYALFYLAWKKYRPYVALEAADNAYMDYVHALSGHMLNDEDTIELGFSGAMGTRVRNAATLAGMLSEYMGNIPARVEQFVPRWVKVQSEAFLGGEGEQGLCLGDNTILGDEVLDICGKIDIHLGPMEASEAKRLLPGRAEALALGDFIKRYLDPTLSFDLVLTIKPSSILGMQLGAEDALLGWSTWIGYQMSETDEMRIPGESLFIRNDKNQTDEVHKALANLAMVA
jgi:type VI secretion system protein ImpH